MQRFVLTVALIALLGATLVCAFDKEAAIKLFLESAEACRTEVGASASDIDEAKQHLPASTYEGKCLRACVMKKFNLLDANGKLNKEGAREKAQQYTGSDPAKLEVALQIGDICAASSVPDDHCEAAEAYGKCFHTEAKQRGLM